MRRLLILASAVVFVDTMFFAAVVPLLPSLSDEFGLSKSAAGVLAGSYAAGTLLAALPGGWLASRIGAKPTVVLGLALMTVAGLAFAVAGSAALLVVARFVQGIGGAASWAGALSWLVTAAPASRRGEMIGTAMGAAIAGVLFGPVLGAAAEAIGRGPLFGGVAVAGLGLIWLTRRMPAPRRPLALAPDSLAVLARARPVRVGMWLILIPGVIFGTIEVLVPLQMDEFGAGAAAIAAVFLIAAGLEALVAPLAGRLSDRRGPMAPIRIGVLGSAAFLCVLVLPGTSLALGVAVVIGAPVVGILWSPAMALLSDGAEALGVDQGLAFGVTNLGWGLGHTVGSLGGAGLGEAAGDAAAYLVLAAACLLTLAALLHGRRTEPRLRSA